MSQPTNRPQLYVPSRREFLRSSTAGVLGGMALGGLALGRSAYAGGDDLLKVGLIGCGGRGTGAAAQALNADKNVKLTALGDAFADRLQKSLGELKKQEGIAGKIDVPEERQFVGFNAYQQVIDSGVDVVVLATPPHFRPAHLKAAIEAGKHVFCEKPVAVDAPGVRSVYETCRLAKEKNLSIVSGLCWRYDYGVRETMKRVLDGGIGDIVAIQENYLAATLWSHDRQPSWSDMEWQLRNWLYFTWLSGDHIVEQHIHNLDVINWAKRAHPVRAMGMGGRQVRTDAKYGHIFDHHDVHYEFADGSFMFSQCRQIDGCANQVSEHVVGTKGRADLNTGGWTILGEKPWQFPRGEANEPYQGEHDDFFAAIRSGQVYNEARYGAESTLTAVMGRMATYSGRVVTWDEAMASERLGPDSYEWGDLPVPPVPVPGRD